MKWTGNNILPLPKVSDMSFVMQDIVVDSYSRYNINLLGVTGKYSDTGYLLPIITLESGRVSIWSGQYRYGSYNTGEMLTISGQYSSTGSLWTDVNGIQAFITGIPTGQKIGYLQISGSSPNSINASLTVNSRRINLTSTIPDYSLGAPLVALQSDTDQFIFGASAFFFQSYEPLIQIAQPVKCFLGAGVQQSLNVVDGDLSDQDVPVRGKLSLSPSWGVNQFDINCIRTLYPTQIGNFTEGDNDYFYTSPFDGTWSGTRFTYNTGVTSSITWHFGLDAYDFYGSQVNKTVFCYVTGLTTPSKSYISDFQLTASGEYLSTPTVKFTGYYAVTGLVQALSSMLFSSGCTGNLPVSFTRIGATGLGATGTLNTQRIVFQDIYGLGQKPFYIVNGYTSLSGGTGYTEAPNAVVATGLYGNQCFDVPAVSGNTSWFTPFKTKGQVQSLADYLTGVPLMGTGLVSGGLVTGYVVTGIDIWNIGSGYSTTYAPSCQFIRNSGDTLTKNASGIFALANTGTVDLKPTTTISVQNGTDAWTLTGNLVDTSKRSWVSPYTYSNFAIQLNTSGMIDTLSTFTGYLTIGYTISGSDYNLLQNRPFTFAHTFNKNSDALKKNNSASGLKYSVGSNLSFLVTQNDLDTLYNSSEWSNNNAGIDVGDLNF